MKGKITAGVVLVLLGSLALWALVFRPAGARPPVEVSLSFSVSPKEQVDFVVGQARSAKLKYDAAKEAGVKSALAMRLAVEPVSGTALVKAHVRVMTKEEGQRFVGAFMALLSMRCHTQAQLALTQSSVK